MRRLLSVCLIWAFSFAVCSEMSAQELIVTSFELKATDLTAKIDPVYDLNDEACALVKVAIAGKGVTFTGDLIKEAELISGEYYVYLPKGTKRLKVALPNYLPMTFEFPIELEEFRTYSLRIRTKEAEKKVNLAIMPSFSYATTQTAYGVLIGVAGKKSGGFIHGKSDFNFPEFDGDAQPGMWYTGDSEKSRWAVTGGCMLRVAKPMFILIGAGYGSRVLAWKTNDGQLVRNTDFSSTGVEAELGCIFKFGAFVIGASAQTNMFKYLDANAFIGVMF